MKTFEDLANPWVGKLGIYEPGRPIEEVARELGFASADEIVKLASNENSLGPSPKALAAMQAAAPDMHRYPDGGAFYLRRALAEKLKVGADQILVGSGSNEIIELMGHAFLDAGSSIVVSQGAFVVYQLVAAMFRARTIVAPMRDFTHDLDAMRRAIAPDTKMVFIANPNNPTGTMVDGEAIDRFMDAVPDHVVVGLDEAYVELLPPARQPDCLRYVREGRKVVVLRTFSKTYGLAGLRVGYAVAPEAGIRLLHRVRQPFNVNYMGLAAAQAALGDDAHVERTRGMVRDGLAYFEAELRRLGLPYVPSVANFLLVRVGQGRKVFEQLQRERIIARPMDGYGLGEYVRITVGTAEENARCVAALARVLNLGR